MTVPAMAEASTAVKDVLFCVFIILSGCLGGGTGGLDGRKQGLPINGLLQVSAGAKRLCPLPRAGFVVSRDDNDGHRDLAGVQRLQHIEAIDPGHVQIQQEVIQWM